MTSSPLKRSIDFTSDPRNSRVLKKMFTTLLLLRPPARLLLSLSEGRPQRSRTQRRLVHPRAHTDITREVARRLGHLHLRRSFRRTALPLHLTRRALARRAARAREPIVHHHVPTCRRHALDEIGR